VTRSATKRTKREKKKHDTNDDNKKENTTQKSQIESIAIPTKVKLNEKKYDRRK